jgi:hypothetical protein
MKSNRTAVVSMELVLVLATFGVALFAFAKLGSYVAQVYFVDGKQFTAIPLF